MKKQIAESEQVKNLDQQRLFRVFGSDSTYTGLILSMAGFGYKRSINGVISLTTEERNTLDKEISSMFN